VTDANPAADGLSAASLEILEGGDPDELTRRVNDLVAGSRWDELVALAARCRLAFERGKQLWGVAAHIEYRLALEAPGRWGALTLETAPGRFAFGPLPEVAASTHTWAELSPHLHPTPQATMSAHERVVRGDDLCGDPVATGLPEVLDLPLRLEPWEPRYALAEYHPDRMSAPSPPLPPLRPLTASFPPVPSAGPSAGPAARRSSPPGPAPHDEVSGALEDLVSTWTEESNGQVRAVGARGRALDALGALGAGTEEIVELAPPTALALMAWAAASGGAHGRRRGAAPGRFAAWWVLATLGARTSWPLVPDDLGTALHEARWYAWAGDERATGWVLRLAVEAGRGPRQGWAWAISARDVT
jgi:hypothetical protein